MLPHANTPHLRSLFCECNYTPCRCWPAGLIPAAISSTSSSPCANAQSHHDLPPLAEQPIQALDQQLPTPRTPSSKDKDPSHPSPQHGYIPPAEHVAGTLHHSPSTSYVRPPNPNPLQLHSILKTRSILRTPETSAGLHVHWDVRDKPTSAVILSGDEPQAFLEYPANAAYATSPPAPYIIIVCRDALPWLIPVYAQAGSAGVTVRDVFQAVYDILDTPITESMLWVLPSDEDRNHIYDAYMERIVRVGDDRRGILAVDWLCEKTLFVCLARDEALARKRVAEKEMWPVVFTLNLKKEVLVSDV
ncbi:hypothetical protein BDV93DRAFT_564107 [Ceratobasidium sp. AG-I]|nr:hypothetical protein BDV93DRAFT_564107 [Ceratobasidium sp. AG-I]